MNKKIMIVIAVAALLGAASGGYFWWSGTLQSHKPDGAVQAVADIADTVSSISGRVGGDLYGETGDQVVIPDVNPYRKANPFTDIKTNPFE